MLYKALGFPRGANGKESACSAGDPSWIPGSGRSPGEGNVYPLHYSCLENPMDRGAWWTTVHGVTKNQTRLQQQLDVTCKTLGKPSLGMSGANIPCYSVICLSSQIFRILPFWGPAYMLTLSPKSFPSLTGRMNASSTLVLKLWLLPQTLFCLCVCWCFTR